MGHQKYSEGKLTFALGDSYMGGKIQVEIRGGDAGQGGVNDVWGFLYWKPNSLFRMQVGKDKDGHWGSAQITMWGFTGEQKNYVAAASDYDGELNLMGYGKRKGFYDGVNFNSIDLSFFPVDDVNINLVLPMGVDLGEASAVLSKFHINSIINIPDTGVLRLAFVGDGGLAKDMSDKTNPGTVFASFYVNAIENLFIDFGVNYQIPFTSSANKMSTRGLELGLGLRLLSGPLTLKVRTGTKGLMGLSNDKSSDDLAWSIGILPSYKFDKFTLFFHAGFGLTLPEKGESETSWFINPYIFVPTGEGRFLAGIILEDGNGDGLIKWKVPFGFYLYF